MGNKRNRRSRRHETPSPDRDLSEAQIETPMQGNETFTNVSAVIQEPSGENESRFNLIEPSQISNEIQVWTENFEQKNNDRIMKMRERDGKQVRCNFERDKDKQNNINDNNSQI